MNNRWGPNDDFFRQAPSRAGSGSLNMAATFSRTTRALAADSPRIALATLGLAAVLLVAWLAWFGLGRVTVYEVSQRAQLQAGGAAREVSALQAGRIVSSSLVIGRRVRAGEVLVELDAEAERLAAREEEARLAAFPLRQQALNRQIAATRAGLTEDQRSAQAAVQSVQAHIREADETARYASDYERRIRAAADQGAAPVIASLRAAADSRQAQASRDALAADARRMRMEAESRVSQGSATVASLAQSLETLQGDQAASEANLARLRLLIANRTIRAPVDGVVGDAPALRPGAFVTEGQQLASIVPGGELLIVAEFRPTTALGRLRPGQRARLRLDGFPWAQYGTVDAVVLRVAGDVHDNRMRVELRPLGRPSAAMTLQHGLTGSVEVAVEDASPLILLLRAAGQWLQGTTPAPATAPVPATVRTAGGAA